MAGIGLATASNSMLGISLVQDLSELQFQNLTLVSLAKVTVAIENHNKTETFQINSEPPHKPTRKSN